MGSQGYTRDNKASKGLQRITRVYKAGSQRGLGLQGSGLKNAGLQGSKTKISGL